MDKETLSNYGWIVVLVLILAVMLALATPFGTFIAGAIKSTTAGFFSVNENALGAAGIVIPGQEFEDTTTDDELFDDSFIKFKQPYSFADAFGDGSEFEMCFVFYEEGKATLFYNGVHGNGEIFPVLDATYLEDRIILNPMYEVVGTDEIVLFPSEDGTKIYFDPEDTSYALSMGSKYDIPINIDTSLVTEIPVLDWNSTHDNGVYTDIYKIGQCESFAGTICFEFVNWVPTDDTDISKYEHDSNYILINGNQLTEEHTIKLTETEYGAKGNAYWSLCFGSSGYYIVTGSYQ